MNETAITDYWFDTQQYKRVGKVYTICVKEPKEIMGKPSQTPKTND